MLDANSREGRRVGVTVGPSLDIIEGMRLGVLKLGGIVGRFDDVNVGFTLLGKLLEGKALGVVVGTNEGLKVGSSLGTSVGDRFGATEGLNVGS